MTNAESVVAEAEVDNPNWYKEGGKGEVGVDDPPRKGCAETLLESISAMKTKRVVSVSCNTDTLARDLRILEDGGYKTLEVQPVDMFPMTKHVEAVALMSRVDE